MKRGHLKSSIAYLFLVLFLSMKMTGLHVLSHSDDKDQALHCAVCDHAMAHNLTPALAPDLQVFAIENTESVVRKEVKENYEFIVSSSIAPDQLFSRPPPVVL